MIHIKQFSSFLIFLSILFTSFAQTDVDWLNRVENLGIVFEGEERSLEFSFLNTGESDLIIRDVRAACRCLDVESYPGLIPPMKKGLIKVKFDSRKMKGMFRKGLKVITNRKKGRPAQLKIIGEVRRNNS